MICRKFDSDSIEKAVRELKNGQVLVLPTDTVYGFSAIVDLKGNTSFYAQNKIMDIKGRGKEKPFIQLLGCPEDIKKYTDREIPDQLLKLWPGPLTVIVPVKSENPLLEEMETVAFRCPGDKWLRQIITECGAPVYSTSVNRSGQPVLSSPAAIEKEFGSEVSLIVDDGDKINSVPSTIVMLEDKGIKLIRSGALDVSSIISSF